MEIPIHKHDCDHCQFLGSFLGEDLYYCEDKSFPTVIARYGENGSYTSGIIFGKHHENDENSPIGEAYRRAKKLNLKLTIG